MRQKNGDPCCFMDDCRGHLHVGAGQRLAGVLDWSAWCDTCGGREAWTEVFADQQEAQQKLDAVHAADVARQAADLAREET